MSPERLNRVQIVLPRETVEIPWGAREELLERLRTLPSAAGIVAKFLAVGTTQPVTLEQEEKVTLLTALGRWLNDATADRLPRGLYDLRNALIDERD
jgi:hypothetical protein